jgi:ABC-type dipeptide/oligopeptide/nickel transport system permease component
MILLIFRRLALLPLTLLAVFTLVFVIAHFSPGSPWQGNLLAPQSVLDNLRAKFHADDPLIVQYVKSLKDVFLTGDLGFSYRGSMPQVGQLIIDALPISLTLGLAAMLLAVTIGIPLGAAVGLRQGHWTDHIVSGLTLVLVSVPAYISAPLLIIVFAVEANWLPSVGWHGLFSLSAVIPVAALALNPMSNITRYTRASVHEAMLMGHVLAAEAKGLPRGVLIRRHILLNGLTSVVTVIGDDFARLLTGTFFVESIYGIPGIGRLLVDAVNARDYPVIIGVSLVIAALVTTINLLIDIGYAMIDPRVGYG